MKFTHAVLALALTTTTLAHPKIFQRTPQSGGGDTLSRNGDSITRNGITQTLVCTKAVQDGFGNVNRVDCEQGESSCNCINRFTEIRCTRVLQDGTGNTSIQACDQIEEGVDGCGCGETVATRQEERCSRAVQDGIGNVNRETCDKSEEGLDGCRCSPSTVLVDSLDK